MSELVPRGTNPHWSPERGRTQESHHLGSDASARGFSDPEARDAGDTIHLGEVLAILRRRAWLVLLCVIAGAGAAYWLAGREVPTYQAVAVIRVQDPTSQMSGQLSSWDASWSWSNPIQSTLEVLRSQSVLGEIVDRNGLRLASLDPDFRVTHLDQVTVAEGVPWDTIQVEFGADGAEVASIRSGSRIPAEYGERVELDGIGFLLPEDLPADVPSTVRLVVRDRQHTIAMVGGGITWTMRPQTNIVDVGYLDTDPVLAQRVVNEAVRVFQERSALDARQLITRRRVFLQDQMAQADTLLRSSQQALSDFRIRGQVFSSQDMAMAQQSGLLGLEMRQEELRADREMYATLLTSLLNASSVAQAGERLQSLVAAPEIAQNPVVASLFAQLMDYEVQREALTSGPWSSSAENPDVVRLDQLIATWRGRIEVAIESHMESLEARAQALSSLRERTAAQLAGLPESEAQEGRLLQEVQAAQRTVEQLREELYRAQLAEAVEAGPVDILDLAALPTASQRASFPVMIALGILLGGLAGSGGAFLLEMLNTKVRVREDLERSLQVQVLGVIPKLPGLGRGLRKERAALASKGKVPVGATHAAGNGQAPASAELITLRKTRSYQAEAFRTLRTNLLYARGGDVRTLVVTSALPEEGKTTTAANLAVTYAQQGLSVLLVDCDLRRPRIDRIFRLPRTPGFTDLAMGGAQWDEVVHEVPSLEKLSVLTAGTLAPNPTELLGGVRTRTLLKLFQERYEIVVLDTPPLAGGADAAILGAASDGVLMVAKAGSTQQQAARLAARQLGTVGARLVGAVMNDPRGSMAKYGEPYSNYEYYG